ncbi:MAG TPA: protocatechuate 3,4-dioxygenase [Ramlibacter sp.]|nr:protocatechuate 3,4-dioxygenase [Ramlibacter sp.]
MNPQLEGMAQLGGTYVFDLRVSHRTLRLNRFFWRFTEPAWRERFVADAEALMEDAGLSEQERRMIRERDWIGLIRYGVSFFVLEKLARVVKQSNLEVYAAMRGETFEQFLQTRRVPDAR